MLRRSSWCRLLSLRAQPTPNPRCYTFHLPPSMHDTFVPDGQTCDVAHRGVAWVHPLSAGLFEQYAQEISSLFLAPRYVAVGVYAHVDWAAVEWSISSYLGHYLLQYECAPIAPQYALLDDNLRARDEDSEVVQCVKELLREQVRPMLQRDGGDVRLVGVDEADGVVSLAMLGACRSCPSSHHTLKDGIERVLRHFLPEVREVREETGSTAAAAVEDFPLVLNSERAVYRDAAAHDAQRRRNLRKHLTPTLLSYEALSEPDGDG